jgi:integrase
MANAKKRKDGLYQVTVMVDEKGKRVRKYFYGKTLQEAKAKLLDYQEERAAGRTFSAVADEWQREHWEEIAAGTQTSYAPALKRAKEDFRGKSVKEIVPLDVKRALELMAKRGYAQHSVSIYLCVLNQIFNHGILMQDITENPAATVQVPKGLAVATRECPEEDQLEIIRKNVNEPFGLFPYMLLYTGLRRGELLALQWRDVDFKAGMIRVCKSVTYAGTGNRPEIKSTKTEAGDRSVILLDRLAQILRPLQKNPDDYLFGGQKPLTQSVFRSAWRRYCLDVGLWEWKTSQRKEKKKNKNKNKNNKDKIVVMVKAPTVTPHQLRHAYATMCWELGIDVKDAQRLLGHSKIEVTMDTYTHIRNKHLTGVAARLNQAE